MQLNWRPGTYKLGDLQLLSRHKRIASTQIMQENVSMHSAPLSESRKGTDILKRLYISAQLSSLGSLTKP